jgi:predicted methyltransferase/DNA-binding transcriptional LysR family regulator
MAKIPLTTVQAFVLAARARNLSRAATQLNVTVSALSHQIRSLEERLGQRLFVRGPRGVVPTLDGERLLAAVAQPLDAIEQALRPCRPRNDRSLTLSMLPTFASGWLVPRLPRFVALQPDLELNLQSGATLVDFDRDAVDAALRFGAGTWSGLEAEHLFDEWIAPVASPALLRKRGKHAMHDLATLPLLGDPSDRWTQWFKHYGGTPPRRYVASFTDTESLSRAALEGLGVALGRMTMAQPLVDAGRLVVLTPQRMRAEWSHYLVYPARSAKHADSSCSASGCTRKRACSARRARRRWHRPRHRRLVGVHGVRRHVERSGGRYHGRRRPRRVGEPVRRTAVVDATACASLRPRTATQEVAMKKLALTLALAALLAGCNQADKPKQAAAPAATPPADQPVTPPPPKSESDLFAEKLDQVLAGSWRSPENKARDVYRHPKETLMFFELKPGQTVIEITPGGGWFSEILAPLYKDNGKLVAAIVDPNTATSEGTQKYLSNSNAKLREKYAADPDRYSAVEVREFSATAPKLGEPGTADVVLTFRNVHNFMNWNSDKALFKAAFDVLKPGGTLGVTDHRAAPGADLEKIKESGYLPESYVIQLAGEAGFNMLGKSEFNANPKDTKDYENGVWTLPPSYALKDKDREKYAAIGESDRMTLRFVKPRDQVFTPPETTPTPAPPVAAPTPAAEPTKQ